MSELLSYIKPNGAEIKINSNSVDWAKENGWKPASEKKPLIKKKGKK